MTLQQNIQNLFYFCQHPPREQVVKGFADLAAQKGKLEQMDIPAIAKMYPYIASIHTRLTEVDETSIGMADQDTMRWCDPQLIRQFLASPADKNVRDDLTTQLLHISAGIGALPDEVAYTAEELEKMDTAGMEEEDGVAFAYTLRTVMDSDTQVEYVPILSRLLFPNVTAAGLSQYDWEAAFLLSLLVKANWKLFPFFSKEQQDWMIGNALYLGIVAGAPVRKILQEYVQENILEQAKIQNQFVEAFAKNTEAIPITITPIVGRSFAEVIKNYLAQPGGELYSGFSQESFITRVYGAQTGRDAYINWLREAMSVVFRIEKRNWTR